MKNTILKLLWVALSCGSLDAQNHIQYDSLSRCTQISYPNGTQITYAYDPVGNRTSQVITGSVAFPLEWIYFTAQPHEDGSLRSQLRWATQQEISTAYFEVEHSTDNALFVNAGEVPAQMNSSTEKEYAHIHAQPIGGINYYRLKQIDLDGSFSYSKVVVVHFPQESYSQLKLFPIPTDDELHISLVGFGDNPTFQVADLAGKEIAINVEMENKDRWRFDTSPLPEGTYVISVFSENRVASRKFQVSR